VADSIVAPIKLTPQEHIAYALLMQRASVSRDALTEAFYGARPEKDWPEGPYWCVASVMSRLKKKLAANDITLRNIGAGVWALPSEGKKRLAQMTPWWER
jgi:hypothetical protein